MRGVYGTPSEILIEHNQAEDDVTNYTRSNEIANQAEGSCDDVTNHTQSNVNDQGTEFKRRRTLIVKSLPYV